MPAPVTDGTLQMTHPPADAGLEPRTLRAASLAFGRASIFRARRN